MKDKFKNLAIDQRMRRRCTYLNNERTSMKKYLALFVALTAMSAFNATASTDETKEAPKVARKVESRAEAKEDAKEEAKDEPHSAKKCFKICMKEIDDREKCNYICDDRSETKPMR